jgi:micrococcal nuclease
MKTARPTFGALLAVTALLLVGWISDSSAVAQPPPAQLPRYPLPPAQLLPSANTPDEAAEDKHPDIPKRDLSKAEICPVLNVVDGDTITVYRNGQAETIRLIGVDTPETNDPRKEIQFYGEEASTFSSNLLKGEQVYLTFERPGEKDKYARTLAHVYRAPDGLWVNLELIRQGYGQVYLDAAFHDKALFLACQDAAKETEKGLWDPKRKMEFEITKGPAAIPSPTPLWKPTEVPAKEVKPDPQKITVYVTYRGSTYHRAGCQYPSRYMTTISIDLEEAKRRYTPCSKCKPPE